ncbi:MAG: DUF2721 domain-containing protein, partial [Gammaproteobacteria bacterium]|nr:DUF2721 domain-containing protein [Gammaproteobacteria bacterium]
ASLLLAARTNQFNAIESYIRTINISYKTTPDTILMQQIKNLNPHAGLCSRQPTPVLNMYVLFASEFIRAKLFFPST